MNPNKGEEFAKKRLEVLNKEMNNSIFLSGLELILKVLSAGEEAIRTSNKPMELKLEGMEILSQSQDIIAEGLSKLTENIDKFIKEKIDPFLERENS